MRELIKASPVARSVPFDIVGSTIRSANVQDAFNELRRQTVYDPEFVTTTTSGLTALSSSSSTMQFVTGTAVGHRFRLPNATTLFNGQTYIIVNESIAALFVDNFGGTELFEILADSVATIYLQSNGTSNGIWVAYVVSGFATGILSYNVTSSVTYSTTSSTYVPITGFTVTPVAGRYSVWYNSRSGSSNGSAINYWAIFKNNVLVTDSQRSARAGSNNADFTASTQTVLSVNGSQPVDVRVYRSGGTTFVYDRSLTLIRLGPEA